MKLKKQTCNGFHVVGAEKLETFFFSIARKGIKSIERMWKEANLQASETARS